MQFNITSPYYVYRIRKEEETLAEKVDRRVLRWFGHVERTDEGRWPRKVRAAEVEGRQGRGRPWLG